MRHKLAIVTTLACSAACSESAAVNQRTIGVDASWLEWPAEVRAGAAFDVRLVTYAPGCFTHQELRVAVTRGTDNVSLRSEWVVEGASNPACLRADPGYVDTAVSVAGLSAAVDQVYELQTLPPEGEPPRLVGTVLVRPSAPLAADINAGGFVSGFTTTGGCAVIQPPFSATVPVDNSPQSQWVGFVRGYFYAPATPLCGQSRAFHIVDVVTFLAPLFVRS